MLLTITTTHLPARDLGYLLILLAKVIFTEIISNTMTKNLNFSY